MDAKQAWLEAEMEIGFRNKETFTNNSTNQYFNILATFLEHFPNISSVRFNHRNKNNKLEKGDYKNVKTSRSK